MYNNTLAPGLKTLQNKEMLKGSGYTVRGALQVCAVCAALCAGLTTAFTQNLGDEDNTQSGLWLPITTDARDLGVEAAQPANNIAVQAVQLEKENQRLSDTVDRLNQTINLLNQNTQNWLDIINQLKEQNLSLLDKLQGATRLLNDSERALISAKKEGSEGSSEARQRVRELEQDNRELRARYASLKDTFDLSQDTLRSALDDSQAKVRQQALQMETLAKDMERLERDLASAKVAAARKEGDLERAVADAEFFKEERDQLRSFLFDTQEELKRTKQELNNVEAQLASGGGSGGASRENIQAWQRERERIEAQAGRMEAIARKQQDRLNDLESSKNELTRKLNNAYSIIHSLRMAKPEASANSSARTNNTANTNRQTQRTQRQANTGNAGNVGSGGSGGSMGNVTQGPRTPAPTPPLRSAQQNQGSQSARAASAPSNAEQRAAKKLLVTTLKAMHQYDYQNYPPFPILNRTLTPAIFEDFKRRFDGNTANLERDRILQEFDITDIALVRTRGSQFTYRVQGVFSVYFGSKNTQPQRFNYNGQFIVSKDAMDAANGVFAFRITQMQETIGQ